MAWALGPQATALVPALAVWVKLPPYCWQMNCAAASVDDSPKLKAMALRLAESFKRASGEGRALPLGKVPIGVMVIWNAGLRRNSGKASPFAAAPLARGPGVRMTNS